MVIRSAAGLRKRRVGAARRRRVLILCTGNSCRSQMAEGLINALLRDRWIASSAGPHPAAAVHPLAVRAMAEVGIDISAATPKSVDALVDQAWDLVVTVCDSARESCPNFAAPVEQVHVSLPDPALAEGTAEERLAAFRAIREDIRDRLVPVVRER